jgi:hypothetical protein
MTAGLVQVRRLVVDLHLVNGLLVTSCFATGSGELDLTYRWWS